MTTTDTPPLPMHLRPYRLCMGIVVFNQKGHVFLGERADVKNAWQLPQGGITMNEIDEDLIGAALRELEEETGITDVTPLAITKDWVSYDFPQEKSIPGASDKYRGQQQKWIAVRFNGDDSSIRLDLHHEIEFINWRWGNLSETPDLIVDFKKPVYRFVCDCFAPIAQNAALDRSKVITLL
jgi:putative (di)nucleoside polyphosphate hydrolase